MANHDHTRSLVAPPPLPAFWSGQFGVNIRSTANSNTSDTCVLWDYYNTSGFFSVGHSAALILRFDVAVITRFPNVFPPSIANQTVGSS
jgi:hypothetical protein